MKLMSPLRRLQSSQSLTAETSVARDRPGRLIYPRPAKGIFVAMTVMNITLASSERLAM